MKHHAAYGLELEELDVAIVEDSKAMQTILRSILLSFKVARVRVYDSGDDAVEGMLNEPPNVILTDWRMEPVSGYQLLRLIRHRHMEPLCFVPVLFVTAHGTLALVNKAMRSGAHHLLVKPLSPSTLYARLRWLVADDRQMILEHSGFYTIQGIHKMLDSQAEKMKALKSPHNCYMQPANRLAVAEGAKVSGPAANKPGPIIGRTGERLLPQAPVQRRKPSFAAIRSDRV